MNSIEMRRVRTLAVMVAAIALCGPAVAGPIVVRASGPTAVSYKPGQKLSDSATLVLQAGDQITVLDAKGTRSFTGPGSFRFDAPSASAAAPTAFAEILTQKPERRARIGAVRGSAGEMTGPPVPPGVWAIDAGRSGTVCAIDPAKAALWRPDPMAAGSRTITRVGDGKAETVAYAAGQSTVAWPAGLVGVGQYKVTGGAAPVTITLKALSKAPAAVDELGAAFLDAGCSSQFDRLANATKVPATAG
jgi:hypothetical protein